MSLLTLSLHTSTVATRRRSEGGKLLHGSKTYDEIHIYPAEMDTWLCFQGARELESRLGNNRFHGSADGTRILMEDTDADWLAMCGRTATELYQCCQGNGQFVLVPRSKKVAYSAPFDQWQGAAYGRPRRFDKATKVTDRTRHLWDGLTINWEGFTSSADPTWWPVYPDHVYRTRAPSLWKCSLCNKEHDNPHWAENWLNRLYIDCCPHCGATYVPRFMELRDLNAPSLSFTERHPDNHVFWIGGETIKRRERPVSKEATWTSTLPF